MTKEQFHEEMGKLTWQQLHALRNHTREMLKIIPSEIARLMKLVKLELLLDDLIDKKKKKGDE